MGKIVRTPTRAAGGVTSGELALMGEISRKWIANALRTDRADPAEVGRCIAALYAAADLPAPRVVLAPGPLSAQLAAGLSCAVWYLRGLVATRDATRDATLDATRDATYVATDVATYGATRVATFDATDVATDVATRDATRDATLDATRDATYGATSDATYGATRVATFDATDVATDVATRDATRDATLDATRDATRDATFDATDVATDVATYVATDWLRRLAAEMVGAPNVAFAMECCRSAWRIYQGGNMWAGFPALAEAARDVLGLTGLDCWQKYQAWEDAAKCGGLRFVHEKFCIVSDFPTRLLVNERNQPHCADGPSHEWRDGFKIYHLNGVRFDEALYWRVVGGMPMQDILRIEDVDQRTQAMRFADVDEFVRHAGGVSLDKRIKTAADGSLVHYNLVRFPAGEIFVEDAYYGIFTCPSTGRRHMEGVEVSSTVAEAMAWAEEIAPEQWEARVPLVHET